MRSPGRPARSSPGRTRTTPTAISEETVKRIVETQLNMPEGFTVHPRLPPVLQRRGQMVAEDAIDWGMGETLAFGSLLIDGHPVRVVGQDTRRGTFTQRHAVLVDRVTGEEHTPLKAFNQGTTKFYIYDSLLSEFAALGFEYGYSVVRPDALVAWEAQFGDFVNGAQSIIDEYITSGEQKWGQRSSVMLLLPHGYEGQGPDHSSARIERFLQMCAPGQHDRRPADASRRTTSTCCAGRRSRSGTVRWWSSRPSRCCGTRRRPRRQRVHLGAFRPVLGDTTVDPAASARSCSAPARSTTTCSAAATSRAATTWRSSAWSGSTRSRRTRSTPSWPATPRDVELVWAQDEPINMGPWPYLTLKLAENPDAARRPFDAPGLPQAQLLPAIGSHATHDDELQQILGEIFG